MAVVVTSSPLIAGQNLLHYLILSAVYLSLMCCGRRASSSTVPSASSNVFSRHAGASSATSSPKGKRRKHLRKRRHQRSQGHAKEDDGDEEDDDETTTTTRQQQHREDEEAQTDEDDDLEPLSVVLRRRGLRYFCLAFVDVQANYLTSLAFQYTTLTGVQVSMCVLLCRRKLVVLLHAKRSMANFIFRSARPTESDS